MQVVQMLEENVSDMIENKKTRRQFNFRYAFKSIVRTTCLDISPSGRYKYFRNFPSDVNYCLLVAYVPADSRSICPTFVRPVFLPRGGQMLKSRRHFVSNRSFFFFSGNNSLANESRHWPRAGTVRPGKRD